MFVGGAMLILTAIYVKIQLIFWEIGLILNTFVL